jgi:formylglycine-generating enzyme required for sulfatase activity
MDAILVIILTSLVPCPPDMVFIEKTGTCIDKYEWPNEKGTKPIIGATAIPSIWDKRRGMKMDATGFCHSVGKRVCSMEEWIEACKGPNGSDYPFGWKLPKYKPSPTDAPCNFAQWFKVPDEKKIWMRDPFEFERLDGRDPSGTRGCVSASGAEDMVGNVEEWVTCPLWYSNTGWCLAGRYWSDAASCYKVTSGHDPTWHYYETGTRCCLF